MRDLSRAWHILRDGRTIPELVLRLIAAVNKGVGAVEREGLVPLTYRSAPPDGSGGPSSRPPPDAQSIARKMAIVAWQPGPNRALAVPLVLLADAAPCARADADV